jgi:uncharacterized protein
MQKNNDKNGAGESSVLMNPEAFFRHGVRYATGQKGPVNLVEAHKWVNIAATLGSAAAKEYRRDLAGELTRAELAQALAAARDWFAQRQAEPPVLMLAAPVPAPAEPVVRAKAAPRRAKASVHDIAPHIEKAKVSRQRKATVRKGRNAAVMAEAAC